MNLNHQFVIKNSKDYHSCSEFYEKSGVEISTLIRGLSLKSLDRINSFYSNSLGQN